MDINSYVDDAGRIFKDLRQRLETDKKFRELDSDSQLDFYQKNNHEFAMLFPITLRYMVQLRLYNKKAFTRFVKKLNSTPYKSELEYCERQADYVKYLFIETSSDHDMNKAQRVWQDTYDMLVSEVEAFKDAEEEIKKRMEAGKNINNAEKREELKKMLGM